MEFKILGKEVSQNLLLDLEEAFDTLIKANGVRWYKCDSRKNNDNMLKGVHFAHCNVCNCEISLEDIRKTARKKAITHFLTTLSPMKNFRNSLVV